tara:strand:+ start:328 stop:1278 length:951 start_codon:yes stop_codon:yes gene_type:complete
MKKIGIIVLSILLFASCVDSERKILIEGTTYVELNVRATPNSDRDGNILDDLDPGDVVQIVGFDTESSEDGIFWCEIRLNNSQRFDGEEIKYGFAAYKVRDLPFIVSNKSWKKIQKMYEMEYKKEDNEILTKSKKWLTPAIYDYVYNTYLHDIQYEHDLRGEDNKYEDDNSKSKYEIGSPSHSVDFDEKQHCRIRITTASIEGGEALYAVIFNQSPRTIHFFRQDERSLRGKFVSSQDFSYQLNSNIKNIERRTKTKRIYVSSGYYGDKTRLELNYDVIRIRPKSGKQRYIIYNTSGYTNANMDGAYLSIIEEYRR